MEESNDDERNETLPFGRGADRRTASATCGRSCAICHRGVESTASVDALCSGFEAGYEASFSCPQGHVLCWRCVRQFGIRTGRDTDCIFCGTRSRRPSTIFSQEKGARSRRTTDRCADVERAKRPGVRNYARMVHIEGNSDYDQESSDRDPCSALDTDDVYEEGVESGERHRRPGYRDSTRKPDPEMHWSESKINGQLLVSECSRRPIRCPRLDCEMNVAFSALTHHFLFDHPEVPILSVDPGAKSTLIVSFAALTCDSSRCLALLLVSGKLSLPLPVLAARLHCARHHAPPVEVHAGGEGQCEGDVIIAWVAGLDVGNAMDAFRCSIQAVDDVENGGFRSLTYTGPVNSLRTAQRPREVFMSGDCIVLHEGLISHITSGCTSLNVNVTVH